MGLMFFLVSLSVAAQKYRTAAGLRIGRTDFGGTVQQKLVESITAEGILTLGTREATATVLLQKHYPIIGEGFNYYIGGGAHVGHLKDRGAFYGGDVMLGTEVKLPLLPLLLSLDVKPAVHVNHTDWFDVAGGLSLRYIIIKEKEKKKKKFLGIFGGGKEDDDDDRRNRKSKKNAPKRRLFEW